MLVLLAVAFVLGTRCVAIALLIVAGFAMLVRAAPEKLRRWTAQAGNLRTNVWTVLWVLWY